MISYCCTAVDVGILLGLVEHTVYSYIAHTCTVEKIESVLFMLSDF